MTGWIQCLQYNHEDLNSDYENWHKSGHSSVSEQPQHPYGEKGGRGRWKQENLWQLLDQLARITQRRSNTPSPNPHPSLNRAKYKEGHEGYLPISTYTHIHCLTYIHTKAHIHMHAHCHMYVHTQAHKCTYAHCTLHKD